MPSLQAKRTRPVLSREFQTVSVTVVRLLSGVLLCAGCVVGLPIGCAKTVWEHPVKGTSSLPQDRAGCEERAGHLAQEGDPHTGNVQSMQDHIDECLRALGYVERSGGRGY
ncbi:MAG: hypothetical protein P0111_07275 [Nitrospira sp.]|nr:hypothetical protein [Nitrospira sp.]